MTGDFAGLKGHILMHVVRKIVLVLLAVLVIGGIAGCNTIKGAGKDIQRGGEALENAADRARN